MARISMYGNIYYHYYESKKIYDYCEWLRKEI